MSPRYAGPFTTIFTQPYGKGLSSSLSWSRALRDFWISASLVTRESKTVGQVAASWKEGRERANQRGEGEGGISYPSNENPFRSVAQPLEWRAISAITTEKKEKKEIVRDDISYSLSPLFIPHPPLPYSSFFLPRCQLLPEWRNLAVT